MTGRLSLSQLRQTALTLHREYEAILVLAHLVTPEVDAQLADERNAIMHGPEPFVGHAIRSLHEHLTNARRDFDITASHRELVDFLKQVESGPREQLAFTRKHDIGRLIPTYRKIAPRFDAYPEHAMIGFSRPSSPFEVWILEATLYEDMAALFNQAYERKDLLNPDTTSKKELKTGFALNRATITSVFFFIESYLNGLAADHVLRNEARLTEEQKSLLTEWNEAQNRPRYLSLREKVLQYQRIILGVPHPVLQESNCPELAFILNSVGRLRDPVVHASALDRSNATGSSVRSSKEAELFKIRFEDVVRVVDQAIVLVRKIEMAVKGNLERMWWLKERGEDGRFPDSAFD